MERDDDTSKIMGEAQQQQEDQETKLLKGTINIERDAQQEEANRLKSTIKQDDISCARCRKPLQPPIFQCSMGHYDFWCSSCRNIQPKCSICDGSPSLERSYGMEHAVRSILVACHYADHGCPKMTPYYERRRHCISCPHHPPFPCPYDSNCSFTGHAPELLEHLTGHHKCPCTEFKYWHPVELLVKPGLHVLRCEDDSQHIHLHTKPVEQPPGYAVYIICVQPYTAETGMGCWVSFRCFNQYCTSAKDYIRYDVADCNPTPKDYLCFVPRASDRPEEEVALKINIACADAADSDHDSDDSSYYIQSEESGDDSS